MSENYVLISGSSHPIKAWIRDVPFEEEAKHQLQNVASLPFIFKQVVVMPDAHFGLGSTIGAVIPTQKAIIPAAVGVDIGCGMIAYQTTLQRENLPSNLHGLRTAIEQAVPCGRSHPNPKKDQGAWRTGIPHWVAETWKNKLERPFKKICEKHPKIERSNHVQHLGTLGTGNHFIELCVDENDRVWIMLHSGSRGVGNRIGSYFIELAKRDMERLTIHLPDRNLAYLSEGTQYFQDYIEAVDWAQNYAKENRAIMMHHIVIALKRSGQLPDFTFTEWAVNCHHNYVEREHHFGEDVWITRKGALRARQGEYGIIPGSMGVKSYIVRGKGNPESFESCSHGAGRQMSRTKAKKAFSITDHMKATEGVECRKDIDVIDETPMAYKDIDKVMAAQSDLVEVVYTLKQMICVKG